MHVIHLQWTSETTENLPSASRSVVSRSVLSLLRLPNDRNCPAEGSADTNLLAENRSFGWVGGRLRY